MSFLIIILLGFLLIWLFVILPQRRRQRAHHAMIDAVQPGTEVITAGGLYGFVTRLGDEELTLEIADGVEVRVAKRAIAAVVPPPQEPEEEELGADALDEIEAAGESLPQERR